MVFMLTDEEKELFERESHYEKSEEWKEEHKEEIESIVDSRIWHWVITILGGIVLYSFLAKYF